MEGGIDVPLKWLLCICIVIAGALCGRSLAWSAERRCRMLCEMVNALRMLRIRIVGQMEPLGRALEQSGLSLFSAVGKRLLEGKSALDSWHAVLREERQRGHDADCLTKPELTALDRLFECLGESGRAEQDQAVRACIEALEEIRIQAAERAAQTGKLYGSIGLLTGMAITVMMI